MERGQDKVNFKSEACGTGIPYCMTAERDCRLPNLDGLGNNFSFAPINCLD